MIKVLIPNNILDPVLIRLTWLIAGLIFCQSMLVRMKNFLRAEQKAKIFNIISIVNRYLELGLSLIFIFFFLRSVEGYYSGAVLAQILILAVLIGNLIKEDKIKLKNFSIPFFKECVQYGYPLVGRELASFIIKFTDRYLLLAFLGSATVGLYSVGADISHYIQNVIFFPVHYAIFPIYMELWSKEGEEKTRDFISKITNYLLVISVPIIFGVCALRKEIVVFLASSKFEEASIVTPYIIIGTIIWGFSSFFDAGLYIYKKTKILTLVVFLSGGVNFILNILLIPIWGMRGAALASLISYVLALGLIMKVSFRYLKINIDVVSVLKYVIASLLMYIVIRYLSIGEGLMAILVGFTIGIVIYPLILSFLDKELMKSTISFFKRIYAMR
jgi:O-antigen/teichoic acid export membrane protein